MQGEIVGCVGYGFLLSPRLQRPLLRVPRVLDAEMLGSEGLNITEHNIARNLSEAPDHSMRMREVANFVSIMVSGDEVGSRLRRTTPSRG